MKLNSISLQRFILYLSIIFSFTGTLWLSTEFGPIHIFPYRILLILLIFLFAISIFNKHGQLHLSHIKVKTYLQFLCLWLAYAFLSIIWAADQIAAIRNIIFLLTGFATIFFLVYYLKELNDLKLFYWLWLLIFIIMIPVGFWEIATGNHLSERLVMVENKIYTDFAPYAFLGGPNEYATYISLTVPMLISWIRYYPKLYSKFFGVLVFVASLFLLIMTMSRGNYLAVLTGLSFWFIFILKLKKKVKILAIGASISILFIVVFPEQVKESIELVNNEMWSLSAVGFVETDEGSIGIRNNLIRNTLYFTAESAGFGIGAGNAEYYLTNYKIFPIGGITNVHNWWAEILLNYGILIFAGYMIFYLSLILQLWKVYKYSINCTEKVICEALLVGAVSFFWASTSSSSLVGFTPQWLYFGFCLAFLNYTRNKKDVLLMMT